MDWKKWNEILELRAKGDGPTSISISCNVGEKTVRNQTRRLEELPVYLVSELSKTVQGLRRDLLAKRRWSWSDPQMNEEDAEVVKDI